MPSLTLYDMTIGYEGVPPAGYAQSYYTLQHWFAYRTPSPRVHLHLHRDSAASLPVGIEGIEKSNKSAQEMDKETTEEDRKKMQEWIYQRWQIKDDLMSQFYRAGEFPKGKQGFREVKVRARAKDWMTMLVVPLMLTSIAIVIWIIVRFTR